ncbi:MAG: magnesium and cobalt transport protein CorA [Deltaproteobacteria bacterium]|nr:MAG: magnesium and cobalt transport protein CorA [Deltaproteobacteria bacterium]
MTRRPKRPRSGHAAKAGLPPGSAVYTGDAVDVPIRAHRFDYDGAQVSEHEHTSLSEVERPTIITGAGSVRWVDFVGLHDANAISQVCERFGLHPLAIEDVLSVDGRPKADDYGNTLFLTAKYLSPDPDHGSPKVEHVALALGDGWVLSFQERPGDPFEPVRKRIRTSAGRIRRMGADYLFCALIDAVVDAYFTLLVALEDKMERLEEDVFSEINFSPGRTIHELRGEVRRLRRSIAPLRLALTVLLRDAPTRLSPEVHPYLRDVLDHLDLLLDRLESARERLISTLEVHLATTSQKTNEVMRGLTVVATLFIPLTFIAGIYGMNFEWMPELQWWWSYPAVLAIMAGLALLMLGLMRARGWLR